MTQPRLLWDHARYPEGPAVVGSTLYFVEYGRHAIQALALSPTNAAVDSAAVHMDRVFHEPDIGFAAVVFGPDGRLWATGYDGNCVLAISRQGAEGVRLTQDEDGRPLVGPNDLVFDKLGGLWFTTSGEFDLDAPIQGRVCYRAVDGRVLSAAEGIHYANGIALDPPGDRLP